MYSLYSIDYINSYNTCKTIWRTVDETPPSVNNVLIFSSGISGGKSSVDLSFRTGFDLRFTAVRLIPPGEFIGTGEPEQIGTGDDKPESGGL